MFLNSGVIRWTLGYLLCVLIPSFFAVGWFCTQCFSYFTNLIWLHTF